MLFVLRTMQNRHFLMLNLVVRPVSNHSAPPALGRVLTFVDGHAMGSYLFGRYEFLADHFEMLVAKGATCYIICNEVLM